MNSSKHTVTASRPVEVVSVRADSTGAALRRARLEAGRTLSDLAEEIGVSAATLSRAETGRARVTAELVSRCARALGLEALDLHRHDVDLGSDGSTPGLFVADGPGAWRRYDPLELEPTLRAAVECFVELGYHGTTVRDLARLAGVSLQGLYHRYPSKQDLLVAVMELLMEDFRARCEAARDEGSTSLERFARLVECFALFHSYRRELAFIGASEMRSLEPEHRARIAEIRNHCQRLVDEQVAAMAEEGRLGTAYPVDASRALVSMLVGIANWYRAGGPDRPEAIAARYVEHALAVVQLRPGAGEVSKDGQPRG